VALCAQCGRENRAEARFCDACGAALAASSVGREERKVVSVLFADLVEFTATAERLDPEDVRALQDPYWRQVRAEIERYGGTVEKFIGDAVVALFGAPMAHEDDPERAVRTALAIRDWAQQQEDVRVRIGIATGEALVRLEAHPLAGEGMASGDVVNTASRLQVAARANTILVDDATRRPTRNFVHYGAPETIIAKGKATPICAWEALQVRSDFGVDLVQHERVPLVGRLRELDLLKDALLRVLEERSPQLVTLVGVPGIGKSRLVHELMQAVVAKPELVTWRRGRSLSYGDGISFWALAEIVKEEVGILETDTEEEAGDKLWRAASDLLRDEDEAQWVERELRPLVGLPGQTEPALDRRKEAFAAWRRFLEALAERRPLVLVFEDLHWADDGLLDFIDSLVEWIRGAPLLVVTTARPELLERRPHWAGGKANAATLSLSPLPERETVQLLNTLLTPSPANETRSLLTYTGGNPLYAEQYARMLAERGDTEGLPVPETVQAIIAARLDALRPEEKALLQDAAVIGTVFWSGALRGEPQAVRAVLHALERKEFVGRESHSAVEGEEQYVFRHVLLRDVAYSQMPRVDRADRHLRAAEWLGSRARREDNAETVARHYLSALEYLRSAGKDWSHVAAPARRTLLEAGERASSLNAFRAAAEYYEQALALSTDDDATRPLISFALAEALHRTGAQEQHERLEQAREQLLAIGNFEQAAEAEAMLADAALQEGRRESCREHSEQALALLHDRRASAAGARVLMAVARHRAERSEYEAVIEHAREALTIAEALDLPETRAEALVNLGRARVYLGDAAGIEDIERGLALALETNSLFVAEQGYEALWVAIAVDATGEFRRLPELYEEQIRVAERLGNPHLLRSAQSARITTQRFMGEWDEALRAADAFIAESDLEGGNVFGVRGVRLHRAYIRQARDDSAGALEDIERTLKADGLPEDSGRSRLPFQSVFLLVELGRGNEARALVDGTIPHRFPWLVFPEFALVAADVGYLDEFRAALDALTRRRPPDLAAQAIIEGRLAEAADLLTQMGRVAAAARVRLSAAEKLIEGGHHAEASTQLDKALAFYRSVRATRYIRQAEQLLAASHEQEQAAQPHV
jgi:class 3 adenylate cyclase/tetratricopeptide (TPR) repeat protein